MEYRADAGQFALTGHDQSILGTVDEGEEEAGLPTSNDLSSSAPSSMPPNSAAAPRLFRRNLDVFSADD